ncbi:hypothetical protein GON03_01090 [Nocardioides sp. MAH-18]|uniref:ATP synthase protein I n=1 Tax=Nocardioides agri TaxID=2682843 RepID=A0A6L6XLY4_9ACTN|nr:MULTISPECIES: hypothetical protein [unclassified Nocardioides]MBA2956613.1 hypothetical protein [Nocardioides sp. CGMCC 1.13656]MVQ47757.1 hypothetical protein [Nocardioides sp. MAH-18]
MTTETRNAPRDRGTVALVRTAGATLALGLLVVLAGALTSGSAAAYGALVGTLIVVGVFGFGTFAVNAVATLMPSAALMFALLTYTLQVLAMGLVFVALSGSGLLDDEISREWLGGTVIAGTLGWLTVQVVLSTSRRIPIYDLPAHQGGGG